MLHKNIPVEDRHATHNYEYADAAARTGATGFVTADLHKLALQLDDGTYWRLATVAPTWSQFGGPGPDGPQGPQGPQGLPGTGIGDMVKSDNLSGLTNYTTARSNLGLGNVDNTSDAGKPVSTAQGTAIGLKQTASEKDASGGYAGLTLLKLNMRNVADTITSWFTNTNTAARTYTLPNKDGTVAMTSDITGTNSGTNTGDNATNTQYSGLVSNATHTGDATGSTALTVVRINGQSLAALGTGILKNTTGIGVPSIAINSDLPAMSSTAGGAVPTPPNNTTTFLRGDGTFAAPSVSVPPISYLTMSQSFGGL